MKRITCIVVEDEPVARDIIENYVRRSPHLDLVSSFDNASSAYSFLQDRSVHLMFLDIQLPDMNGILMFRTLENKPQLILASAHHEFAVEGFNLNAVDYLLKPYSFERFEKAVKKALVSIFPNDVHEKELLHLASGKKIYRFVMDEIIYFEACGDYVKVLMSDSSQLIYSSLKKLEQDLDMERFARVHRSYIVNVAKIDVKNIRSLRLGVYEVPIGSAYSQNVIEKIDI